MACRLSWTRKASRRELPAYEKLLHATSRFLQNEVLIDFRAAKRLWTRPTSSNDPEHVRRHSSPQGTAADAGSTIDSIDAN